MSQIILLATVKDPAAPNTVLGAGTLMDYFGTAAEVQIRQWQSEGKVSLPAGEIRGIRVAARAATTAQIAWTVDQACTGMKVDYGTTAALGSSQAATPAAGVGDVVANLTGLTTATLYYYRVFVYHPSILYGTYSVIYTFTTA